MGLPVLEVNDLSDRAASFSTLSPSPHWSCLLSNVSIIMSVQLQHICDTLLNAFGYCFIHTQCAPRAR